MRAANDFFVVGMAGIGTALFLTQLLIVSQQIVSAQNRIQAELDSEKSAVSVNWIDAPRRIVTERPCCIRHHPPPPPPPGWHELPRHYDISSASVAGPPIFKAAPVYPERAEDDGISGYVDFVFTTSPDGSVVDPEVVAEVPEGYGFATAAANAFRRWRFEPHARTRNPGPTLRYRMNFRLPNK